MVTIQIVILNIKITDSFNITAIIQEVFTPKRHVFNSTFKIVLKTFGISSAVYYEKSRFVLLLIVLLKQYNTICNSDKQT